MGRIIVLCCCNIKHNGFRKPQKNFSGNTLTDGLLQINKENLFHQVSLVKSSRKIPIQTSFHLKSFLMWALTGVN